MFRIGEFSRLSHVSIKTLRYYDELGLFKPHHVDAVTGYRSYSVQQLPRLHQIITLKDLGFSLQQIGLWLNDGLTAAEFEGLLRGKYAELAQHITNEQARLDRIGAHLKEWEQSSARPADQVTLKTVQAQSILSIRDIVPTYPKVGALFGELHAWMYHRRHHTAIAGAWFVIYHDAQYCAVNPDVEAVIPVSAPLAGSQRITARTEPPIEVVSAIHTGGYDSIKDAYGAAMAWIEDYGYRLCGAHREVYLRGPDSGSDPMAFVTEVQIPVKRPMEASRH